MTMHEETHPVTLVGGPLDGTEIDVVPSENEIHRYNHREGWEYVYRRRDRDKFDFDKRIPAAILPT